MQLVDQLTSDWKARIEEITKEARKADREDRHRADLFEALVLQEGWKSYQGLLDARLQLFSDALMQPAGGVDGMVALEFVKGAMYGLLLAKSLPGVTISAMKAASTPAGDDDA